MRTYKHIEDGSEFISLHDCYASGITIEKGKISVDFDDGFWITPNHSSNNLKETVRTDFSSVDFFLDEASTDISVSVFRKTIFNRTIREMWTIEKLMDSVKKQGARLEFLYQFKSCSETLFECWLHFDRKPYFYECQIRMPTAKAIYKWNNLCPNRVW